MTGLPHVDGVTHRDVEVPGVRLHVAEAGQGEPLLLLHGWPQHWYCWRRVIPALAAHRRLICPDLRGFGWSQAPGHGYDPETFAADTVALLDALGIEKADVMGHDWGGYTAFLLGVLHPTRVRRLMVLNAPHPWPLMDLRSLDALWRAWYAVVMALAGRAIMRRAPLVLGRVLRADNARPDVFSDAEVAIYADRLERPEQARATQLLYRHYLRIPAHGLRGRYALTRLHAPTRLLFGVNDFAISKSLLRGYEEHADDMQVELVQGSGHFLAEERPELVSRRALEFFT